MSDIRDPASWGFETRQLHVGQEQADPATGARAVPIYATTSYVFRDGDHAADLFALRDSGHIYGRMSNPTQAVFEERIAALENGSAALATASGAAAIACVFQALAKAGEHIVAAKTIYGGTFNLLANTLPLTSGITTTFVDPDVDGAFEAAITDKTKAIFVETLGNPNSNLIDIEAVAAVCGERFDHIGDRRRAGGYREGRDAALQGCDALFQHLLRGVGQAAVDVARVPQAEAVGGVLGIVEHIGRGGVNRHGPGVGGGIGLLLADMKL